MILHTYVVAGFASHCPYIQRARSRVPMALRALHPPPLLLLASGQVQGPEPGDRWDGPLAPTPPAAAGIRGSAPGGHPPPPYSGRWEGRAGVLWAAWHSPRLRACAGHSDSLAGAARGSPRVQTANDCSWGHIPQNPVHRGGLSKRVGRVRAPPGLSAGLELWGPGARSNKTDSGQGVGQTRRVWEAPSTLSSDLGSSAGSRAPSSSGGHGADHFPGAKIRLAETGSSCVRKLSVKRTDNRQLTDQAGAQVAPQKGLA